MPMPGPEINSVSYRKQRNQMKFTSTHRCKLRKGETDWTRMELLRLRYTRIQRPLHGSTQIEQMILKPTRGTKTENLFGSPTHLRSEPGQAIIHGYGVD